MRLGNSRKRQIDNSDTNERIRNKEQVKKRIEKDKKGKETVEEKDYNRHGRSRVNEQREEKH